MISSSAAVGDRSRFVHVAMGVPTPFGRFGRCGGPPEAESGRFRPFWALSAPFGVGDRVRIWTVRTAGDRNRSAAGVRIWSIWKIVDQPSAPALAAVGVPDRGQERARRPRSQVKALPPAPGFAGDRCGERGGRFRRGKAPRPAEPAIFSRRRLRRRRRRRSGRRRGGDGRGAPSCGEAFGARCRAGGRPAPDCRRSGAGLLRAPGFRPARG